MCLLRCDSFQPHAPSNRQTLSTCYRKHENITKRANEQRVREVKHGFLNPLVMSLNGGLGNVTTVCYKRLAFLLSSKWDQPYSSTIAWIRCRLSFALLCSSIQCMKGACSISGCAFIPPINLVFTEAKISSSL